MSIASTTWTTTITTTLTALSQILWKFGMDVIGPLFIVFLIVAMSLSTISNLSNNLQWKNPSVTARKKMKERHRKAQQLYQTGVYDNNNNKNNIHTRNDMIDKALKEWTSLTDFGPAYLSLATHALYMDNNPLQALHVFSIAQELRVRIDLSQVEMIQKDAQIILVQQQQQDTRSASATSNGLDFTKMIEMNARMAKLEHLGILTIN